MKHFSRVIAFSALLIALFSISIGAATTYAATTKVVSPYSCGSFSAVAQASHGSASVTVYEDACGDAYAFGRCIYSNYGIGVWFSTSGITGIDEANGQGSVRNSTITPSTSNYDFIESAVAQCSWYGVSDQAVAYVTL